MEKKKVIIIGAGIAGMSAGSYLQRNDYDTEIFEAHSIPGGLCTAWKRGDYTFDYCIHWLMGTKEDTGVDIIWDELGALENEEGEKTAIFNFQEFIRIELSDGEVLRLYADTNKLKEELLRLAPEDEKMIRKFTKDLKIMARLKTPVNLESQTGKEKLLLLAASIRPLLKMLKYVRMSAEDFFAKWKSPRLQEAFRVSIPSSWSAITLVMGLAAQDNQAAGYPIGGSLTFARNIERRYLALGGKINYNKKVEKILLKDKRAVGIRLENGEEIYADEIVSAADGYTTLYKMLGEEYLTEKIKKIYEEFPLFPSTVHLGLGVNMDLSELPHEQTIYLPEPLELPDGTKHQYINLNIYNFDPTLAPAGKTAVTVLLNTWNDSYWQELAVKDPTVYQKIKSEIGEKVIEVFDKRIPGFKEAVEEVDVSTPYTVKRYTGNWHGSFEGFAPTPYTMKNKVPKEIPGLDNFFMIGQWTEPGGGLPPAGLNGRSLAGELCKRDGKKFTADFQ